MQTNGETIQSSNYSERTKGDQRGRLSQFIRVQNRQMKLFTL